jgi:hypothetical protein
VADERERAKEEAEEGALQAESDCQTTAEEGRENYCTSEDCKWLAWRLYSEGNFGFTPLSRAVNQRNHADHERCPEGPHNPHWAERAIDYCGKATAEALDRGGLVALATLLQGYQADAQAQLQFATGATQTVKVKQVAVIDAGEDAEGKPRMKRVLAEEVVQVPDNFLRSLARSRVSELRAKQAAALGVVTERKGVAVGQDPTLDPVQIAVVDDAELTEAVARIRARNGYANGNGNAGATGDGPVDAGEAG